MYFIENKYIFNMYYVQNNHDYKLINYFSQVQKKIHIFLISRDKKDIKNWLHTDNLFQTNHDHYMHLIKFNHT